MPRKGVRRHIHTWGGRELVIQKRQGRKRLGVTRLLQGVRLHGGGRKKKR